jgi:antitoxin component YwqK of YwqJK toxin-antitoxin module
LQEIHAQTSRVELPKGPWSDLYEIPNYKLVTCPDGETGLLTTFTEKALSLRYHSGRWCPKSEPKDGRINQWKFTSYDEAGRKIDEGEYLEGKMHGRWISWYPNGVKKDEGYYLNGEPIGSYISWHDNGEIAVTGNYLDGKQDGIWVIRDFTGRILKNVYWHLGMLIMVEHFD